MDGLLEQAPAEQSLPRGLSARVPTQTLAAPLPLQPLVLLRDAS
jgi:hypothetical protein